MAPRLATAAASATLMPDITRRLASCARVIGGDAIESLLICYFMAAASGAVDMAPFPPLLGHAAAQSARAQCEALRWAARAFSPILAFLLLPTIFERLMPKAD